MRKAYEQVVDQLREMIAAGELLPGERLPNEATLAKEFGISRATVREALRTLSGQNLVRTGKGAGGGTYVTLPTVDHISDFLRANINLLTDRESFTLDELLEAREILEIPAAGLAARRRHDESLSRLQAAIPDELLALGTREQFVYNKQFHSVLLEICGNTLIYIAAQPLFSVLQTNLARSSLGDGFHRAIHDQHQRISAAVASGDAAAAEQEMRNHLAFLRPAYEKAWRTPGTSKRSARR